MFFAFFLLASCDDDEYPECENRVICDFNMSSWNLGSTNYWIYGKNPKKYYYYDGSTIGQKYVNIDKNVADSCDEFDEYDVLTWPKCDSKLEFNCDFIVQAKLVYRTFSSRTAHDKRGDKRYMPGDKFTIDQTCDL